MRVPSHTAQHTRPHTRVPEETRVTHANRYSYTHIYTLTPKRCVLVCFPRNPPPPRPFSNQDKRCSSETDTEEYVETPPPLPPPLEPVQTPGVSSKQASLTCSEALLILPRHPRPQGVSQPALHGGRYWKEMHSRKGGDTRGDTPFRHARPRLTHI